MRVTERLRGDRPRVHQRQSRRSFSPAERKIGGVRGPARVADIGGMGEIGL